jgi:hypothetical protein
MRMARLSRLPDAGPSSPIALAGPMVNACGIGLLPGPQPDYRRLVGGFVWWGFLTNLFAAI